MVTGHFLYSDQLAFWNFVKTKMKQIILWKVIKTRWFWNFGLGDLENDLKTSAASEAAQLIFI